MNEAELKKHIEAGEKSPKQIATAVSGLPEKVLRFKPAPDKWCILEILGHLADIEIVSVMESEIAEVRCKFQPKAAQPLGFSVEAISVATDESESSVTVDRF